LGLSGFVAGFTAGLAIRDRPEALPWIAVSAIAHGVTVILSPAKDLV